MTARLKWAIALGLFAVGCLVVNWCLSGCEEAEPEVEPEATAAAYSSPCTRDKPDGGTKYCPFQ